MKVVSDSRFLSFYSGALTAILAVTFLGGFAGAKKVTFDEISVQRINVVEPDGTIRLIVSNKAKAPGVILKGKEYEHPSRHTAGLIFFDDEGTESGGLIFGGQKDKDGKVERWGHLSFDQYDQDQVFSIDAGEENGRRKSGIAISDRGDYPILDVLQAVNRIRKLPADQQDSEMKKLAAAHSGDAPRAYLGRAADRSVGLRLMDTDGRDRLRLRVNADGSPVMEFLDASGKVTAQLPSRE